MALAQLQESCLGNHKVMMQKWYVVQVVSSHENKVKKSLEENCEAQGVSDLIGEVLVPTENVSEVKKGKQSITEKRMWPGYIFVKMNLTDDAWMFVRNTNSVLGFLGGEKPTPLTDKEVHEIMQDLEEKKKEVVHKHKFAVGDRVKITDGVFINFVGNIIEVFQDKGRVSVMVSIFGRETRVDDLEFWQVEQAGPETE